MNLYEYQRSRSFIDLGPRSLGFNIFIFFSSKKLIGQLKLNFMWSLHGMGERKSSIGYSSPTTFVQMMTLGWPWPIVRQGRIWSPMLLYGKRVNSETIIVCDIRVCRCSQLNEYMKLYEYQRSRSFIDLGPNHSDSIFLNFFSWITADFNISSALSWAIHDTVHRQVSQIHHKGQIGLCNIF